MGGGAAGRESAGRHRIRHHGNGGTLLHRPCCSVSFCHGDTSRLGAGDSHYGTSATSVRSRGSLDDIRVVSLVEIRNPLDVPFARASLAAGGLYGGLFVVDRDETER